MVFKLFLGAFDARDHLYLFGAAGGGLEGSPGESCVALDDPVAWSCRECRGGGWRLLVRVAVSLGRLLRVL